MKSKNIIVQSIPLLIAFALEPLIQNELAYTVVLLILLLVSFKIQYHKREWLLFGVGVLAGLVLEVGAGQIYRLQYWEQDSLFGVPYWLPILWGIGFVYIRRIGNAIAHD